MSKLIPAKKYIIETGIINREIWYVSGEKYKHFTVYMEKRIGKHWVRSRLSNDIARDWLYKHISSPNEEIHGDGRGFLVFEDD